MEAKRIAAKKAVENIRDGMTVALGSGSTAAFAIEWIGERVRQGLNINAVASSVLSETQAREFGISILPFASVKDIDIAIDGADEIDSRKNLIKGGGGSLLREKVLAFNSRTFLVIADESKQVSSLGKFPLAVEIIPFASELTLKHLQLLKCKPLIRKSNDKAFVTDNGNLIADCSFGRIDDPIALHEQLKSIPGVVETGLFPGSMVTNIYIGCHDGSLKIF